jgi:hypothetical protein
MEGCGLSIIWRVSFPVQHSGVLLNLVFAQGTSEIF